MSATSRLPTYQRTHRLRGRIMRYTLGAEDDLLRDQATSSPAGRAAKTLVKEGSLRIVLVALRKGAALQRHQVGGHVSLQSIRGCLKLTTDQGEIDVPPGGLIALEPGVAHAARAADDCAILLTVLKP